jgi:hypothetical protein
MEVSVAAARPMFGSGGWRCPDLATAADATTDAATLEPMSP